MFRIFLFVAVFFGIIYGIFKLFFHLSNSLLLIDETFINYIKSIDDNTVQKFINEEDFLEKTNFLEKSLDQKTSQSLDKKEKSVYQKAKDFLEKSLDQKPQAKQTKV